MNKPNKTGVARLRAAAGYSIKGLQAAWRFEEAFRLEVMLALVCVPLAWWLARTHIELIVLLAAVFAVIMAELVNSAIEAVVDRTGSELHELSGRAKDIGSAVVFVSIVQLLVIWVIVAVDRFIL